MASYAESCKGRRCLILGDGDFSFTCDFLLHSHLEFSQVITSSLESREYILTKKKGGASVEQIGKYPNATILFGLDATKLHESGEVLGSKFDQIIFNFPHVGGKSNIGANRRLLKCFLLSSSLCLAEQGYIDVALCQGQGGTAGEIVQREYNNTWKVVEMAAEAGLVLSTLKLFSPSQFPNYSPTGFRSRDLKFHLERSLVHTFVSHCDSAEPPSLPALLGWRQLIPDCPYPMFEVGDSLIPFEVRNRFNRALWDIPHHPIQQVSSLFIRLLDSCLPQYGLERGDTLYPSPILSPDQLSLQLSPPSLSQILPQTYKCYKRLPHRLAELLLSPSLLCHIPALLSSGFDLSRACITALIGETYRRCGISHLPSEQPVSNQLLLLATAPQSHSCALSLHSILLQLVTKILLSSSKQEPPVSAPGNIQYSELLDNPSEIRYVGSILATTAVLKSACLAGQEGVRIEVGVVNLDTLATLLYGIPDVRILWSRSSLVLDTYRNMPPLGTGTLEWTPPNLHPLRLQHDLCFWHPWERRVPEHEVATAIRCYCEEYALSAVLFNEFVCPLNRLSHNYRLVLESCDFCLSRSRAHRLQSLARELLRDFYGVELRYNDFYQLYEKLKREFPDAGLKLPGKRLLGNNFDPEFIKARQEGLNEFISKVCTTPKIFTHSAVKEFLAIDDPRRTVKIYTHEKLDDHKLDGDVSEENRMDLGTTENAVAKVTDFELLTVIGKGSFGKVLLARKKAEDKYYALKVLEKAIIMKRNEVKHIMAERNVLIRNLKHPFLVGLHYSFQTGKKLYFVLDYVNGGELFFHLQRERTFEESRAKFYAAEITSAIGYLHEINIIYRDLKPENILLDKDGHIKLTDFGLCKEGVAQGDTTSTFCGTPEYLAPEVLKKQEYSNSVDWWCVGVVLYEMMYGLPPFYSRNITEMYEAILYKPLQLKSTVSSSARSILESLLQKDRRYRLGSGKGDASELYQHPFFHSINWDDLFNKRSDPPFKPKLNGDLDLQNFDPEFTSEAVPIATPADTVSVSVSKDTNFAGFSYIGESSRVMS